MKLKSLLKDASLGSFLLHFALASFILLFAAVGYFYVYLPGTTNHGEHIVVPDLTGIFSDKLDSALKESSLRFEVSDSSYENKYEPLMVIHQFPRAGSVVKPGRKIFITINRLNPPTVPLPDMVDGSCSLINAEAILKSNDLVRGRIIYVTNPFPGLVTEMRMNGKTILPGTRIQKGSVIDLYVGDGSGPKDFVLRTLEGLSYKEARQRLLGWNLHEGNIRFLPADLDTTSLELVVYKQQPAAGDSVRVGDPIQLWLMEKGYTPSEEEIEGDSVIDEENKNDR